MASQWPEELATVRRGAALERRPTRSRCPSQAERQRQKEARSRRAVSSKLAVGTGIRLRQAAVAERSRRAQPPSALEHGDARATVLADGSWGKKPPSGQGPREEVKAPRTGGSATEELRLPSTSFALTGDRAHNRAAGTGREHNSSVSIRPAVEPTVSRRQRYRGVGCGGRAGREGGQIAFWAEVKSGAGGSRLWSVTPPSHAPNRLSEFVVRPCEFVYRRP